jgi:hypothetical protein
VLEEETYLSHFAKDQIPATMAPSSNSRTNPTPTPLADFRYRPSLGGESEPCGKYGGGLSVAITMLLTVSG